MAVKSKMKWNCGTDIRFYSHTIDKSVLDNWNEKMGKRLDSPILMKFVDSHSMKLQFYMADKFPLEDVEIRANMYTISLMVALNLAEPGAHIWWFPALWPVRYAIEENWQKIGIGLSYRPFTDRKYRNEVFDDARLRRFGMIFSAAVGLKSTLFYHYTKAMNLLSSPSPEVKFYEEIFINFWKCIELFIAVEIKKNRKRVDRDDILQAFEDLGKPIDEKWLKEIKKLYKLRGNTIAHSYGKEESVTFEEVGKCKVFADFLMYSHLIKRAKKELEGIRKERVEKPNLEPSMGVSKEEDVKNETSD